VRGPVDGWHAPADPDQTRRKTPIRPRPIAKVVFLTQLSYQRPTTQISPPTYDGHMRAVLGQSENTELASSSAHALWCTSKNVLSLTCCSRRIRNRQTVEGKLKAFTQHWDTVGNRVVFCRSPACRPRGNCRSYRSRYPAPFPPTNLPFMVESKLTSSSLTACSETSSRLVGADQEWGRTVFGLAIWKKRRVIAASIKCPRL